MPELPDIVVYLRALEPRLLGQRLLGVRVGNPFLLRTAEPPLREVQGRRVVGVRRLGKRIAITLEDDLHLVLHLMIAGRLHWKERASDDVAIRSRRVGRLESLPHGGLAKLGGRNALAAFEFENGTLLLTEAGTKRRASLHLVRGEAALEELHHRGLEVLEADFPAFQAALTRENHTLKRALTDPRLFSGIGNAYADEILHRARLSPFLLTHRLSQVDARRLFEAARGVLEEWTERLTRECGDGFPEKVTAFRPEMAVHGRYGQPCPACGSLVQRIVYAENEANYCATCQTEGRLLADRALSRLLKDDWPRTLVELEERRARPSGANRN